MKRSHFSGSKFLRWLTATPFQLLETKHGECPDDGDDSVDSKLTRGRLVAAADRQGTGDRPRHGGAIPTFGTTRTKTSHCAHRLGRAKCSHFFAPAGSSERKFAR